MDTWWRFGELFELAHIVVLRRPGYAAGDVLRFLTEKISADFQMDEGGEKFIHPALLTVHYLKNTRLDVSSTTIRRLVSEGRSIRYLVAGKVFKYIMENGVYKTGACAAPVREERHEWRK